MTKGELRKARKAARAAGEAYVGPAGSLRPVLGPHSRGARRERGLDKWAKWYDGLNGAPEGDSDR